MNEGRRRTIQAMGTLVTIDVREAQGADAAVELALQWFATVEACCSRFDEASDIRQLATHPGIPRHVNPITFEAVRFALAIAEETDGAFDPAVGRSLERLGFNRHHLTGAVVETPKEASGDGDAPSYRDILLDERNGTITVTRPLVCDLGAVAKGFAIDLAARELQAFEHFAINAGGDLYLAGSRPDGSPWSIGIAHPRAAGELIDHVRVSNMAVCTSGDYERTVETDAGPRHHILDPRTGTSAGGALSVTVIAPNAMLADGLATAAFVLGPVDGLALLRRHGVQGIIVSPDLTAHRTEGMMSEQPA